jgi:hypothetical protein
VKRSTKFFSIIGSITLVLFGAGMALSPAAQAAAESVCAAPGNSYCWSQPDTGNDIVLTDTTNIASFTPESCETNSFVGTETCELVAVDGACVRAQDSTSKPVLLDGCGGSTEYSEYWFRVIGCNGYYYWANAGATMYFDNGNTYVAYAASQTQGEDTYIEGVDDFAKDCTEGSPVNQWIWG